MLSVVLLMREQPSATYLLNRVQDLIPVQKVIYESWDGPPQPDTRSAIERIRGDVGMYARYYRRRIEAELSGSKQLEINARSTVFGQRWQSVTSPPQTVEILDRDWNAAREELAQDPPDLILVFGTGLIPDEICKLAKLACINIHTGLSPHYRGQNCTHFCILNEDLENIGVTVHLVRKAIDGGEILVQRRPEIAAGDNEFTLIKKNERLGADIYCEIIQHLLGGKALAPQSQPPDVGLLLMNRALTPGHKSLVRKLVKEGAVDRYLERVQRNKIRPKPILETLQNRPSKAREL